MLTIAMSGPQASGKTTLAKTLGRDLGIPVFSRDPLMTVLFRTDLPPARVPRVGLDLQTALLTRQLELGQSCVLECVMPRAARDLWRRMTEAARGRFVSVECVCSDPATHRARFENRRERSFGWDYVLATMRRYRPDAAADHTADSVRSLAENVAAIRALLG